MNQLAEQQRAPFSDPRDAIRWADNYLLQPDCKTITGKLMDDMIQQPTGGRPIYDEQSMALQITTTLAGVQFPNGKAVRLVYGRGESDRLDLADRLAHETWESPEKGKTIGGARDLALLVMEQVKQRDRYGRRFPTAKRIAAEMKLGRSRYYDKWGDTHSRMLELFTEWVSAGINDVGQRLVDVGVVG